MFSYSTKAFFGLIGFKKTKYKLFRNQSLTHKALLNHNPFGRTGAIGQGLLPVSGRNQATYLIVVAANRVLTCKVTDTENRIPFHVDRTNEKHFIDDLERNLNVKFYTLAYDMLLDSPFNTGAS